MIIDEDLLNANLIKLLGLELLPLEKKVKIMQQASELVQKRLLVRLLGELKDEEKAVFLNLLEEAGKDKEKERFVREHFPNFEQLISEEIVKVKNELQGVANENV